MAFHFTEVKEARLWECEECVAYTQIFRVLTGTICLYTNWLCLEFFMTPTGLAFDVTFGKWWHIISPRYHGHVKKSFYYASRPRDTVQINLNS